MNSNLNYEEAKRQKTKAIRSQLIGMAVMKTCVNEDVHIHYVNENPANMPPSGQPTIPAEKFTMNRDEFHNFMRKQIEEQS